MGKAPMATPEGVPRAAYLVRWIMCEGMGPRIFSIITKCSRFSWVYWKVRDRASRSQYQPLPPQKNKGPKKMGRCFPCPKRCEPTR